MKKFNNVLVLSAGRRVELVEAFQDSLNKYFKSGKVYTTDLKPELSSACQISSHGFKVPRVTSPNYIDSLIKICLSNNIGLVVPTIDTELQILADNISRFESQGINLIISSSNLIEACGDKRKTSAIYEDLNIDQPKIYSRNDLSFPCFCKPYDGSSGIGAFAILSHEMLTEEILNNEKNMFMELVDKEYSEYTIDAYYDRNGNLCCIVPRERIEVRGGEVSKGASRKNFVYYYLINRLKKLKGGRGCVTVQVFANSTTESIKALEINPRFGGGYPLAHAAGAEYTDWLIKEYILEEEIDFFEEWENNLLMLRYDAKVLVHEHSN